MLISIMGIGDPGCRDLLPALCRLYKRALLLDADALLRDQAGAKDAVHNMRVRACPALKMPLAAAREEGAGYA